jgi:SAM-dependent methyltransferase
MEISEQVALHRAYYDSTANGYANDAPKVRDIVREVVDWFCGYLKPGSSVLDIGPGVGIATAMFCDKGYKVSAIELSPAMAAHAARAAPRATIINEDFFTYEFDGPFDGIFACAILHLYDRAGSEQMLRAMHACLREDGHAYVNAPLGVCEDDIITPRKTHYQKHTDASLDKLVRACGFSPVDRRPTKDPTRPGMFWTNYIIRRTQ